MRVAVLAGGRSSEHDISLASAEAIRAGLEEAGHVTLHVELARDGGWSHQGSPVALEPGRGLLGADVVFPALHGPFGEDGTVQGLLELVDVPYVGAGVAASAVAMDKLLFKDLMAQHHVPQVEYLPIFAGPQPQAIPMGYPVFVKPARLGSSVGISKVRDDDELSKALASALEHDSRVIVEAASAGLEVECSVIGNDQPEASRPGEIVIHADWYDYGAKYEPGGMELVVPPRIPEEVQAQVRELAVEAYRLVDCTGMARVDFFVEEGGRVLVNELNTIPGFTPTSVFSKLWEESGVPYTELLERLLTLAIERYERERRYRH